MALAVNTPTHLKELGLLPDKTNDDESRENIGYLFHVALQKLVFLPFAYTMDLWRWRLFEGEVGQNDLNSHWWEIRRQLQGIDAPVERSEDDFDAGAKYHIPGNFNWSNRLKYLPYTILIAISVSSQCPLRQVCVKK